MKAITLHQPWASLVAAGWKEVETRSWSTPYRGPLAIHAGKKRDRDGRELWKGCDFYGLPAFDDLPFGVIVATCQLASIHRTGSEIFFQPKRGWHVERGFGNYSLGRFAWVLKDVVPVDPPIPAHGWQQLWNWEPPQHVSAESGLRP